MIPAAELYAPPPRSTRPWVPAGITRHGRLYRRPVLAVGELWHPVLGRLPVDLPLLHQLVANFRAKLTGGHVAVNQPDHRGHRTEDPDKTVGEVIAMAVRGRELLADIDIRDVHAPLDLYQPAMTIHGDFTDTNTGRPAGPAVLGVHLIRTPTEGAAGMSADSIRTPGVRFRLDANGVARPVPRSEQETIDRRRRGLDRSTEAEIARLSAQAVEMGLSRSPDGPARVQPTSTAALVARYAALGRELGVSGPDASSPGAMPSLGR